MKSGNALKQKCECFESVLYFYDYVPNENKVDIK